ncbi:MAG TPA: ComEC/Rec2 family competence protein [Candidatus Doudnabacteria bacterium]|nr:ComEC/Rec2 family competence protein [Candidatus Doudnabacteria bacterium]
MTAFLISPICWGVIVGLVLARFVVFDFRVVLGVLIVSMLAVGIALLSSKKTLLVATAFICGASIGTINWHNAQEPNQYESLYGQSINIEGEIVSRPSITAIGNQALIIRPDGFTQYIRVSLFHHTVAKGGERVWIRGQIKKPENFSNFNYIAFLIKNNVYAELSKAKVIIYEPAPEGVSNWLRDLRQNVVRVSERNFNTETSAIVLGMLIGHKEQLPEEVESAFQKSGLIHILVVSGFNLTIIAIGVGVFARWFGRRLVDTSSLLLIWSFCILVGATSAVIRAGVMASILILSRLFGRLATSSNSLLLAVVIMSLLNPWQLFYDIGFQLSVAATFGVLEASHIRTRLNEEGIFSEIIWPSMGAIICTAPLIAYYFGTVSLVAPLANLLVLPIVPYLMLFGVLGLIPYLEIFFVPVTELLVAWELKIISTLANWQFSQLQTSIDMTFIVCYYVILILFVWLINYQKSQLKESQSRDKITQITI